MKIVIVRTLDNGVQTIGQGFILNKLGRVLFSFKTLELSYKNNARVISSIPCGHYKLVKRFSRKFKNHLHILNVPNRDFILIHLGNFFTDIMGCVIVGDSHTYINKDGQLDVVNSGLTMDKLLSLCDSANELVIIQSY